MQGGGYHFYRLIAYNDDLSGYIRCNNRDRYPLQDGMREAQRMYVAFSGAAEGDCKPASDQKACDTYNHLGGPLSGKTRDDEQSENNSQQKHCFPMEPRSGNQQPAQPEQGSEYHVPQMGVGEKAENPEPYSKK